MHVQRKGSFCQNTKTMYLVLDGMLLHLASKESIYKGQTKHEK